MNTTYPKSNVNKIFVYFSGMVNHIRTNMRRQEYGTEEMVVGLMFISINPSLPPIQIHSYWNLPIDQNGWSLAKSSSSFDFDSKKSRNYFLKYLLIKWTCCASFAGLFEETWGLSERQKLHVKILPLLFKTQTPY